MNDILSLSAAELGAKLKARDLSPVDAVEACLERIEATMEAITEGHGGYRSCHRRP